MKGLSSFWGITLVEGNCGADPIITGTMPLRRTYSIDTSRWGIVSIVGRLGLTAHDEKAY